MVYTITRHDDLDGSPAAEEITFAIGGRRFTIDLSTENAATFREILAPWIQAARPAGKNGHRKPRGPEERDRSKAIRAWAQATGLDVKDSGRLPAGVIRGYDNRMHPSGQVG